MQYSSRHISKVLNYCPIEWNWIRDVMVSNETNTDVCMYIEEFIVVDVVIGNAEVYIQTQ